VVLTSEEVERVAEILGGAGGLVALYVFGSVAAGRERPGSDLDLACVLEDPPAALELLALQDELASVVGRPVDLVLLDRTSPILAMQVLRTGRRLVDLAPARTAALEARLFSAYADLKRVRAPAERALVERCRRG